MLRTYTSRTTNLIPIYYAITEPILVPLFQAITGPNYCLHELYIGCKQGKLSQHRRENASISRVPRELLFRIVKKSKSPRCLKSQKPYVGGCYVYFVFAGYFVFLCCSVRVENRKELPGNFC